MPMAVIVLLALFAVQRRGTARIGQAFGPVMLVRFATIAVLGVGGIRLKTRNSSARLAPTGALGMLGKGSEGGNTNPFRLSAEQGTGIRRPLRAAFLGGDMSQTVRGHRGHEGRDIDLRPQKHCFGFG